MNAFLWTFCCVCDTGDVNTLIHTQMQTIKLTMAVIYFFLPSVSLHKNDEDLFKTGLLTTIPEYWSWLSMPMNALISFMG